MSIMLKNPSHQRSSMEQETLARKLHEWYLEATAQLSPESYNPDAQKPYDGMTEEQKSMDRYIAGKIIELYR